jgi:hypothetical protein
LTVAVCTPVNSYIGNDTTNTYPFTFPVWNAGQFSVTAKSTIGATTYTLINGTDYTVSGLNPAGTPASTGSITLISNNQLWIDSNGFLSSGWTLTIERDLLVEQEESIRNQSSYYPETLEDALDYLTMLLQDLDYAISQIPTGGGGGGGGNTTVNNYYLLTPYLVDTVTGISYSLEIVNGVLSQLPISAPPTGIPASQLTLVDTVNGNLYYLTVANGALGLVKV